MVNLELKDTAGGHPDPEELAAFIDGGLGEADAARIRAHLGRCEDCYDVFVEAVRFQRESEDEEGSVRPFRPRRSGVFPSRTAAATALAASLVALLGLVVYRGLSRPPGESTSALTADLAGQDPALVQQAWPPGTRGMPEGAELDEYRSFRLGVEAVSLNLALRAEAPDATQRAASRTVALLARDPAANQELMRFYQGLAKGPEPRATEALAQLSEKERMFPEHIPGFDRVQFSFGGWAEAGRLAALSPQPAFFQAPEKRRFPGWLRRELGSRLQADRVDDDLRRIEEISGHKTLTAPDREALVAAFENILRRYYSAS